MSTTTADNPQTKVVVATALISAVSTIAVSFIGIVPMIRRDQVSTIKTPQQSNWRIEGKVHDHQPSGHVGAQLFLMKADSTTHTDAAGKFVFDEVPEGYYWLQVEVEGETSNRYLVGPSTTRDDGLRSFDYLVMQRKGESQ
jgi:hypothetical protein